MLLVGHSRISTRVNVELSGPFTARAAAPVLNYETSSRTAQEFLAYSAERAWLVLVHHGLHATVPLSDPSRTLVDVLDDLSLDGYIRHIAEVLRAYFESEHPDDVQLTDYIWQRGNRTVFKRLSYLLEVMEIEAASLIQVCQVGRSAGVGLWTHICPFVVLCTVDGPSDECDNPAS